MKHLDHWRNGGTSTKAVLALTGIITLLCLLCGACSLLDSSLRAAGVLPTRTATLTSTVRPSQTPRPTPTSRPTRTIRATATPRPPLAPAATATAPPTLTATLATTLQVGDPGTALPAQPTVSFGTTVPMPTENLTEAVVIRVVDGDTIKVRIAAQEYTVRYIGIDTPETVHPSQPVEWMGAEASAANRHMVEGKTVYLEKDISETDRYGRLLRYVWVDGIMADEALVRAGFAAVSTYPPDVKYQEAFRAAEREAREAGLGLWGATPVPVVPVPPTSTTPPTAVPSASQSGARIAIVAVNKQAEYIDIANRGDTAQSLAGWVLVSEKGDQRCGLAGVLEAGQTLRIWALSRDAGQGGYNCGLGREIWNNSEPDPAALYDAGGNLVDRSP